MIRLFKLISGEEIVARVQEETPTTFVLKSVRALVIHPAANGQMQVGMMPWSAGVPDGNVTLYKTGILGTPEEPLPKQLEDGYLSQTSGIQLAGGGGLR